MERDSRLEARVVVGGVGDELDEHVLAGGDGPRFRHLPAEPPDQLTSASDDRRVCHCLGGLSAVFVCVCVCVCVCVYVCVQLGLEGQLRITNKVNGDSFLVVFGLVYPYKPKLTRNVYFVNNSPEIIFRTNFDKNIGKVSNIARFSGAVFLSSSFVVQKDQQKDETRTCGFVRRKRPRSRSDTRFPPGAVR